MHQNSQRKAIKKTFFTRIIHIFTPDFNQKIKVQFATAPVFGFLFHLFSKVKIFLGGQSFSSDNAVKIVVDTYFQALRKAPILGSKRTPEQNILKTMLKK